MFVAVSFIAVAVFVIFFICSCFLNLSVSDSGMPHHNFFCQALQTDVLSHGLTGFYNRVNRHENRKLNRNFHYIFMAKIIARCDVDITPFQPMMLPLLCKLNNDSASLEDSWRS